MKKEDFEMFLIGSLKIAPSHEAWDYCIAVFMKTREEMKQIQEQNAQLIAHARLADDVLRFYAQDADLFEGYDYKEDTSIVDFAEGMFMEKLGRRAREYQESSERESISKLIAIEAENGYEAFEKLISGRDGEISRDQLKRLIQDSIEKRFLHKYSNLDQYDIKGSLEREIRNDAENCADRLVDELKSLREVDNEDRF